MKNCFITSKSVNNTTGSGRLIIEGDIPVPREFDDPVVELFRPIRAMHEKQLFFAILTARKDESTIVCTFVPSNHENLENEELLRRASAILPVLIDEYETVLNLFFNEETGLKTYLSNVSNGEFAKSNEAIKEFVRTLGLEMPSIQKKLAKIIEENKKKNNKKPAK